MEKSPSFVINSDRKQICCRAKRVAQMGRITIFSSEGCPHCKRVEAALEARDIPFVNISVTKDPKRLADLVALCDRTSTPQVFFNTAHVGGADETLKVLQKWDDELLLSSSNNNNSSSKSGGYKSPLHRYQVEIASNFDPVNPRFAIPHEETQPRPEQAQEQDHPATSSSSSSYKHQDVVVAGCGGGVVLLPSGQKLSILEITETLKQILPRVDHVRRPMLHKKCFTANDLVKALSSHYALSDCAAIEFAQSLKKMLILHPVQRGGGRNNDFCLDDAEHLFRLQCDDQPHVLNSYRVRRDDNNGKTSSSSLTCATSSCDVVLDHAAMKLVNRLKDEMMEIEGCVTDNDGGVHYIKAQDLAIYTQFEEAVCELQIVNLSTMNDKTKNVFCINLYNLMIKYAFMKLGAGTTPASRHAFFCKVGFDIGGYFFSFQDFENGLLRGNRRAPYSLRRAQFSQHDARRSLVVKQPDFRFHFGVNCGAKSCPPVRIFSVKDLDNELNMVASSFCEDDANVLIHENKNEISVSKIFYWYKTDFVGNNHNMKKQMPDVLVEYLRGTKKRTLEKMISSSAHTNETIKVTYLPYDWTPNIKNVKTFNAADLKTDVWGFFVTSTKTASSSLLSSSITSCNGGEETAPISRRGSV